VNIGSKSGYPSSSLSNFAPHRFVIDGVECASLEGWLQSLKFDKEHVQVEVCKLVGLEAKYRGKKRNGSWQRVQTLWWKGVAYDRHSTAYQKLLDRAYYAAFEQCDSFRRALAATGDSVLTHSIGHNDSSKTVLTEREFCRRLTKLRELT
jgi:predicted NAD-dependent protein-ADP-ribosyltransferase YbiA (DUF1768 family)